MPRKYQTSPSSGDVDDEQPANSPLRLKELEAKVRDDPRYRDAWFRFLSGNSGAPLLDQELEYRVGSGQRNVIVEVYGPPGIGKSMVAIILCENIRSRLEKRGIKNPFALTWNYFQSKEELFRHDGSGERVTVIQDEDKLMSGPDIEIGRKAFLNFLKQGRKLGHNLIKCDTQRDPGIAEWVAFALCVWGQRRNSLIVMFEDSNGVPIDFIKARYPSKAARDHYEKLKDKSLHKLSKDGGNVAVEQVADDANAAKIYDATLKKYAGQGRLSKDYFFVTAKRLFAGKGYNNCLLWAGLAFNRYRNSRTYEEGAPIPGRKVEKESKDDKGSETSVEILGHQWEPEFAETVAPKLYVKYTRLGNKGQPDGLGELADGSKEVVALEATKEAVSKTVYVGSKRHPEASRIESELIAARTLQRIDVKVRPVIVLYIKSIPLNRYFKHEFPLKGARVHTFHFQEEQGFDLTNTEKPPT